MKGHPIASAVVAFIVVGVVIGATNVLTEKKDLTDEEKTARLAYAAAISLPLQICSAIVAYYTAK